MNQGIVSWARVARIVALTLGLVIVPAALAGAQVICEDSMSLGGGGGSGGNGSGDNPNGFGGTENLGLTGFGSPARLQRIYMVDETLGIGPYGLSYFGNFGLGSYTSAVFGANAASGLGNFGLTGYGTYSGTFSSYTTGLGGALSPYYATGWAFGGNYYYP